MNPNPEVHYVVPDLPNGGEAVLWLEIYDEDGHRVCGIWKMRGQLDLPPKAWVRTVRASLAKLEALIKEAGCDEVRFAGRWRGVFPDYEPFDKLENGYRKLLTDG